MKLLLNAKSKMDYLFESAKRYTIDDSSKVVLMSDLAQRGWRKGRHFYKEPAYIFSCADQI